MIKLIYDPWFGISKPDSAVDEWVRCQISLHERTKRDYEYNIGSELIIDRFRLAMINNEIDINQVEFWFNNEKLTHNEYANIIPWPLDFCCTHSDLSYELIKTQINKRKAKHKLEKDLNDNSMDQMANT